MTAPEASFEVLIDRLEAIVDRLESSELSLEDAIDAYQEGVTLAKEGHKRLFDAEQRIERVTRGGQTEAVPLGEILDEAET